MNATQARTQRAAREDADRRGGDTGRRDYDARPLWPMYVSVVIAVGSVVWGAAMNAANVQEMKAQVAAMQVMTGQLRSAVDVLNCKVGITCRTDGR